MIVYLIGIVFSVIGFYMLYDTYYFRKYARYFSGKVIGHKKIVSSRTSVGEVRYNYFSVIEYSDGHDEYEFVSDMSSSTQHHSVGERVDVLVLGDNHATARVKQGSRLLLAYVFSVVGSITLITGLFILKKDIAIYLIMAAVSIAGLYYLIQLMVAASRKKKIRYADPRFVDDRDGEREQHNEGVQEYVQAQGSPIRKTLSLLFLVLAFIIIGYGLNNAYTVYTLDKTSVKTQAVIVDDRVSKQDGLTLHTIVAKYTPYKGKPLTIDLHTTLHPKLKVGDTVVVSYQAGDPLNATTYSEKALYAFVIFIMVVGFLLLIISFLMMPKKHKHG